MAYTDYLDTVQKFYVGYCQRPADPGGLIYWAGKLDEAGGNQNAIIAAFSTSAESTTLYGTIDSSNIGTVVDSIYTALFGRVADAGGKAYYVAGFNAGTFTAGTIALNVLNGSTGDDRLAINNKVAAANLFTATIDPGLDGRDYQATYSGDADAVAARTWLTGVTLNPVTVPDQAETTAAIQTSIANLGDPILLRAAGTFTLTANAPSITEPFAGTKVMTFALTLGSVPTEAVTVNYATQTSGTATSGTDFVAATGTVTFAAGQTVANVSVVVNSDATAEGDETVAVKFSGTALVADVTGTGTILANDTVGNTVVLTAGVDAPVLTANDDTINTDAPTQLTIADTVAAGAGTDKLSITPTINVAYTLDDAIFTNVTGIDKIVLLDTGTGAQTITTGTQFQHAFDAAGVDLDTTSTTGTMTINLGAVTGPLTLTTHSTTGSQTITTPVGSVIATVNATSTTGPVGITTGAGADVVTLTTADVGAPGNVIATGAGNDSITILNCTATTNGNTITPGLGADTITITTSTAKNVIVIANADSGVTVASADRIVGFLAANDTLKMGTVATAGVNYVEAGAAVASFAAAHTAADTAFAASGTVQMYSFQWDATNGYLFKDADLNGVADQVVVLVGITDATISAANINA